MLPLLVDSERTSPQGQELLRAMVLMQPAGPLGSWEEGGLAGDGHGMGVPPPGPIPPWQEQPTAGGAAAAAFSGLAGAAAGYGGSVGVGGYGPAAAANYRANLLRTGDLPDAKLAQVCRAGYMIYYMGCRIHDL